MTEEPGEPSDGMTQPSREKPQWVRLLWLLPGLLLLLVGSLPWLSTVLPQWGTMLRQWGNDPVAMVFGIVAVGFVSSAAIVRIPAFIKSGVAVAVDGVAAMGEETVAKAQGGRAMV